MSKFEFWQLYLLFIHDGKKCKNAPSKGLWDAVKPLMSYTYGSFTACIVVHEDGNIVKNPRENF